MKFRRAVFILSIFVILAGAHLFVYTQNIGLKYQVTDLKVRREEARSKNRERESRAAEKENLANIEKLAREKLKMVYPEGINYILPGSEKASREANP